jgi:hypothetical protein
MKIPRLKRGTDIFIGTHAAKFQKIARAFAKSASF